MSFIKTIEQDAESIWAGIEKAGSIVFQVIEAVIVDEYKIAFQQEILPLIKQAAVNLQNESPGLDAKTFIPAVVAAVVPLLPIALKDIEETAIYAITSTVAGLLGVSNTTGNQGVVS
jgi:hypothetical protein